MSYKRGSLFLLFVCVFGLFSGCGQTPSAGTQSAEDTRGGNTEFITVSDAQRLETEFDYDHGRSSQL